MQICLSLSAITASYSEESKKACEEKKQKYFGDLPRGSSLVSFLLQYIKDLKSDSFSILLSKEVQTFFQEQNLTLADIPKLSEEAIQTLKQQMIYAPGNRVFRMIYDE